MGRVVKYLGARAMGLPQHNLIRELGELAAPAKLRARSIRTLRRRIFSVSYLNFRGEFPNFFLSFYYYYL